MRTPMHLAFVTILAATAAVTPSWAADTVVPTAPKTISGVLPETASSAHEAAEVISASRALRRKLNRVGIASVAAENDPNASDDLMSYVRQLGSLQLPQPKPQQASAKAEPGRNPSPSKLPFTATAVPGGSEPNQVSSGKKYADQLISLLGNPSAVIHAFAAAEILYRAGDYKHAAAFYRIALDRMNEQKHAEPEKIAWTLYQVANCLRVDDPVGAADFYTQLITQYPNSPWTPAAAVQQQVISWYEKNRPDKLLEKHAHDPNSL
ncbi:MAG: hypothetical protein IH624_04515 [Phycisphaerae bacterium]|nr:hypothetical protein [Phycisphaerae bacterium]